MGAVSYTHLDVYKRQRICKMKKRLIDCTARELAAYTKEDLLRAIAESEGRVLATETIGTVTPMLVNITNAEFEMCIRDSHTSFCILFGKILNSMYDSRFLIRPFHFRADSFRFLFSVFF